MKKRPFATPLSELKISNLMQLNPEQVDLIVKRVVAQLVPTAIRDDARQPAGLLQLNTNVVAVGDLPGGITVLEIGPNTILTPLAMDELRQRGVAVKRTAEQPGSKNNRPWLINDSEAELENELSNSAEQVVKKTLELFSSFKFAVVETRRPFQIVCLLNRFANIRAAYVTTRGCIEAASRQLEPNIWVINPELTRDKAAELLKYFELKKDRQTR